MQANGTLYVALLNPRTPSGDLDYEGFTRQARFVGNVGVSGFAINGATGELPATTESELAGLLEHARAAAPQCDFICCVGGADLRGVLTRSRVAADANATALLLPIPYFFPYRQEDVYEFAAAVAESTDLPILLYHLPQFTSGYEVDTVLRLLDRYSNIAGVKDSSGSLDLVRALTEHAPGRKRLIGNDSALCAALREGVCDGVISGVASVLPGLMKSFFQHAPASAAFVSSESRLNEFIQHIAPLPTPWGLKCASEALGLTRASYSMPLSAGRRLAMKDLAAWFLQAHQSGFAHSSQDETIGA